MNEQLAQKLENIIQKLDIIKQKDERIEDLTERRDRMLKKIKSKFHQKYYMSNI